MTCTFSLRLLSFALMLLCASCGKKAPTPAAQKKVAVSTVTVEAKDVPIELEYIAITQSSRLVNINARVNGFLEKRIYTEGEIVQEGQVLFLMDKKPFQAQVDAAEAALNMKKASMETARLNLNRTKPLTEMNALSQKDLDDATGTFQSSSAAVEQAKAQLETALLNLSYCTISSPLYGISSAAIEQDGSYINVENSKLTTVAALSPMWANFSVSENEIQSFRQQISKGLLIAPKVDEYEVEILLVDGSVFPHKGKITFADPNYNQQTGTFLIRVSVDNPEAILRPNQYVRVRLKGAIRPQAILVPQRAVQQSSKGHYVFVVDKEGKADMRPVVVGTWHGTDWFINEGLRSGDVVIVDGGMTLRPGTPVEAKPLEEKKETSETDQTQGKSDAPKEEPKEGHKEG
ncbi:efflux RND transporter periplasmic adaptor subunit [Estrella lausannensis]|uniref:RND family efflux transporter MFP subunit n=1 Tax=Estrella lausannensis TaxID=483423 RepID=A0A0H5DN47_9BACT|nr:efflux RND transporter periplasmic adaptor subunit [Estrella lausannensis]CRX37666.1 RND family efflux transporter MFP subunit [Estrella lausannensis]